MTVRLTWVSPPGWLAVALAVPVAVLGLRHRSRFSRLVETFCYAGYALPGLVIGRCDPRAREDQEDRKDDPTHPSISKLTIGGHPIHHMLIVFPLGLLATSFFFDLAYLATGRAELATVAWWMIFAGVGRRSARPPRKTLSNRFAAASESCPGPGSEGSIASRNDASSPIMRGLPHEGQCANGRRWR